MSLRKNCCQSFEDFQVVTVRKDDIFFCRIGELNLIESGENIQEVYKNLEKAFNQLKLEYEKAGLLEHSFPESNYIANHIFLKRKIMQYVFILSTTISLLVIFNIAASIAIKNIKSSLSPKKIMNKVESELVNMTPEQVNVRQERVKKMVNAVKPFTKELKKVLDD